MRGMKRFGSGLLGGALYAIAYVLLWRTSIDQWFLPAGARYIAILVAPKRVWPYLYLGDMAAIGYVTHSTMLEVGLPWYILSCVQAMPIAGLVVGIIRKRIAAAKENKLREAAWILSGAAAQVLALEMAGALTSILFAERYPYGTDLANILLWSLGDYLGILMLAPAALLWLDRSAPQRVREPLSKWLSSMSVLGEFSLISLAFLFAYSSRWISDSDISQCLRFLALVPALIATYRSGLSGACISVIAMNLGIGLSIPHIQADAARALHLLPSQEVFALGATALVMMGASISKNYQTVLELGLHGSAAEAIARHNIFASEKRLQDRALKVQKAHDENMMALHAAIQYARARGHPQVAMDLMRVMASEQRNFEDQISDAIYPLTIERNGLYAALRSASISEPIEAIGIEFKTRLLGSPDAFSEKSRLAIYRTASHAIEYFTINKPPAIRLRVTSSSNRKIAIIAVSRMGSVATRTPVEAAQLVSLGRAVDEYGGHMKIRLHGVKILVPGCIAGANVDRAHQSAKTYAGNDRL